jgi:hypothetical protein
MPIERFGQQLRDDFTDGTAVLLLHVLNLVQDGIVYVDRRSGHDDLIIVKLASDVNSNDARISFGVPKMPEVPRMPKICCLVAAPPRKPLSYNEATCRECDGSFSFPFSP